MRRAPGRIPYVCSVQVRELTDLATLHSSDAETAAATQTRTLRLLFVTQVAGGVGLAIGASVGALLAADMASIGISGLVQSASVMGAALLAVPLARIVRQHGRRPSLAIAYLIAALGALLVVTAALTRSVPLLFAGFFLFGGGSTAGLQARYAAVDLAPPDRHGRHMSLIVWATTIGAVAGPNLAYVAGVALDRHGIPTLAGPFVFSVVLFALSAAILLAWLRPDPLLTARRTGDGKPLVAGGTQADRYGMRAALQAVMANPAARLGIAATAAGHVVMVAVMAMTPVHIAGAGHTKAHTLRIVGVVLSLHVAGMYAFAPLMGWLADRIGRYRVVATGAALLLAACATAGMAGHDQVRLAIGLTLLGLGWSATMIAGSTLLSESISSDLRPSAQGLSDLSMGVAAAVAGGASGIVVQAWGYSTLTLLAAVTALPLLTLTVRRG